MAGPQREGLVAQSVPVRLTNQLLVKSREAVLGQAPSGGADRAAELAGAGGAELQHLTEELLFAVKVVVDQPGRHARDPRHLLDRGRLVALLSQDAIGS